MNILECILFEEWKCNTVLAVPSLLLHALAHHFECVLALSISL